MDDPNTQKYVASVTEFHKGQPKMLDFLTGARVLITGGAASWQRAGRAIAASRPSSSNHIQRRRGKTLELASELLREQQQQDKVRDRRRARLRRFSLTANK